VLQNPDRHLRLSTVAQEVGSISGWTALEPLWERHPLSLSTGQKRLVTVASALAAKPDLLFLDEPGVGLDRRTLSTLLLWLEEFLAGGGGLVLATHDLDIATALGGDCLILENGGCRTGGPLLIEEYFA